jgi:hypothetical protein
VEEKSAFEKFWVSRPEKGFFELKEDPQDSLNGG